MTALKVLLIIVLVLFLISLIRLGGQVRYSEDGLLVRLIAGPLRITLYPAKPKEKKPKKEKKPTQKKGKKPDEQPGEEKPEPKGGMLKLFMEMLPVIGEAAGALKRKLRIDDLTVHLTWATDDPAKTALGFGRANAILGMIWPVFDHNFKVKKHDLGVAADFDQSRPTVYCNAALTMTVGQLVAFGLRFGIKLLVIWSRNRKGPAKKQEVQS